MGREALEDCVTTQVLVDIGCVTYWRVFGVVEEWVPCVC